ncbi:hypothetical protein ALP47_04460, partial [Pseudomonas savastanoi]
MSCRSGSSAHAACPSPASLAFKHSHALQLQGAPLADRRGAQAPAQDAFRLVPSPPVNRPEF